MNILIPTDYSDNALKALKYVLNLYTIKDHSYFLLNVQNARHAGAILTIDINKDMVKHSKARMTTLIENVQMDNPTIKIEGIVTAGTFIDSVLEKVEEYAINLVAIGTKGAGGVKNILLGSSAATLITNCSTPIIVVPENAKTAIPVNSILAADFAMSTNPERYDLLLDLCYLHQIQLSILHISKPNGPRFLNKDIPFNTEGLNFSLAERVDTDIEYSIINFATENKIDLIAIIKSKGGFIHDLFHSSLTKKLGMHSDTPLLVMI